MTLKKFWDKPSSALGLTLFTFKKNISFTVIAVILTLMVGPFRFLKNVTEAKAAYDYASSGTYTGPVYKFSSEFSDLVVWNALVAFALLFLLIVFNFSYLYKKSASDAYHSFPLTRTKLMLSRFIPAVVLPIIPLTVGYAGEMLVATLFKIEFDLNYVLLTYLFMCLMLFFCGAALLIFTLCAGTLFDMIVSLAGICGGIPLIIVVVYGFSSLMLFGFDSSNGFLTACGFTSPFAYLLVKTFRIIRQDYVQPLSILSAIVIIVLTVAVLVACAFIYNRRKSEKAGEAYAFKIVPILLAFIVAFLCGVLIGMLFGENEVETPWFWVSCVIGSLLGAVCYGAVVNRGFKTVKRSLMLGTASFLCVVILVVIISTGGFGYETRIPKNDEVKQVEVTIGGIGTFTTENPENVRLLHKDIVDKKDMADYSPYFRWVNIDYNLKNGTVLSRSYRALEVSAQAILNVVTSDEMAQSIKNKINFNFEVRNFDFYCDDVNYDKVITAEQMRKFVEIYVSELKNISLESLLGDNVKGYNQADALITRLGDKYSEYYNYIIFDGMESTRSFLLALPDKEEQETILKD